MDIKDGKASLDYSSNSPLAAAAVEIGEYFINKSGSPLLHPIPLEKLPDLFTAPTSSQSKGLLKDLIDALDTVNLRARINQTGLLDVLLDGGPFAENLKRGGYKNGDLTGLKKLDVTWPRFPLSLLKSQASGESPIQGTADVELHYDPKTKSLKLALSHLDNVTIQWGALPRLTVSGGISVNLDGEKQITVAASNFKISTDALPSTALALASFSTQINGHVDVDLTGAKKPKGEVSLQNTQLNTLQKIKLGHTDNILDAVQFNAEEINARFSEDGKIDLSLKGDLNVEGEGLDPPVVNLPSSLQGRHWKAHLAPNLKVGLKAGSLDSAEIRTPLSFSAQNLEGAESNKLQGDLTLAINPPAPKQGTIKNLAEGKWNFSGDYHSPELDLESLIFEGRTALREVEDTAALALSIGKLRAHAGANVTYRSGPLTLKGLGVNIHVTGQESPLEMTPPTETALVETSVATLDISHPGTQKLGALLGPFNGSTVRLDQPQLKAEVVTRQVGSAIEARGSGEINFSQTTPLQGDEIAFEPDLQFNPKFSFSVGGGGWEAGLLLDGIQKVGGLKLGGALNAKVQKSASHGGTEIQIHSTSPLDFGMNGKEIVRNGGLDSLWNLAHLKDSHNFVTARGILDSLGWVRARLNPVGVNNYGLSFEVKPKNIRKGIFGIHQTDVGGRVLVNPHKMTASFVAHGQTLVMRKGDDDIPVKTELAGRAAYDEAHQQLNVSLTDTADKPTDVTIGPADVTVAGHDLKLGGSSHLSGRISAFLGKKKSFHLSKPELQQGTVWSFDTKGAKQNVVEDLSFSGDTLRYQQGLLLCGGKTLCTLGATFNPAAIPDLPTVPSKLKFGFDNIDHMPLSLPALRSGLEQIVEERK